MLRPSPNHGTQRLPNDDDDDDAPYIQSYIWFRQKALNSFSNKLIISCFRDSWEIYVAFQESVSLMTLRLY